MKTIVLYAGHMGATRKAAELLRERCGADVADLAADNKPNIESYDTVVFGANIRMFRINKRLKKAASKLKKSLNGKQVYVYLVGCDLDHRDRYLQKVAEIVPQAVEVFHLGGELHAEGAKGFVRAVVTSMIEDCEMHSKPLPQLNAEELERLAKILS